VVEVQASGIPDAMEPKMGSRSVLFAEKTT